MITVTLNRSRTSGPDARRWNVQASGTQFISRDYTGVSDASVRRLFNACLEYGYHFRLV